MNTKYTYFSSESVTEGHPDKLCDQISDAVLDEILKFDKNARVACETIATTNLIMIMGEITANATIDYEKVIKKVLQDIGYDDLLNYEIVVKIDKQSPDIAIGVDDSMDINGNHLENELGAGDQGIMFGYACNETEEYMPLAISLAHKLTKKLSEVRKNGTLPYLKPDGKSQVTIKYDGDTPVLVDTIVLSTQHDENVSLEKLREDVKKYIISETINKDLLSEETKILINPTGRFVVGGPEGDSGLTGRKIIVDTYGGYSRHGGGAFSGKDPTKVDRSASYMARYIAKNVVASKIADKCEIQLAYAIGVSEPVSVYVNTFNTSKFDDDDISRAIKAIFKLTPSGIIKSLDLQKPLYYDVASYGHMGRDDLDLPWEKTDKTKVIIDFLNN